jgi:hypothetical protein
MNNSLKNAGFRLMKKKQFKWLFAYLIMLGLPATGIAAIIAYIAMSLVLSSLGLMPDGDM